MPSLAGQGVALSVQVAFPSAPGATTPTWTTIPNAKIRSVSIRRGRQRVVDKFSAGTCTVVFDNRTRHFDPSYVLSPYYPNVVPMKKIRIAVVYAATTYVLFTGYIDGWQQQYSPPRDATATVTATDAFKVLAGSKITSLGYSTVVLADAPNGYWRLGDTIGSPTVADLSGHSYTGTLSGGVLGAAGALTADTDTALDLTGASGFVQLPQAVSPSGTSAFTIEAWVKVNAINDTLATSSIPFFTTAAANANDTMRFSVTTTNGGTLGRLRFSAYDTNQTNGGYIEYGTLINDNLWHHVVAVRPGNTAPTGWKLYVDGTQVAVTTTTVGTGNASVTAGRALIGGWTFSGAPNPVFDGWVDEVAIYTSALSAARILAHYQYGSAAITANETSGARINRLLDRISFPSGAGNRAIDTGQSQVQAVTNSVLTDSVLTSSQNVEATEAGRLFVDGTGAVTFQNRQNPLVSYSLATFGDAAGELHYADVTLSYDDQLIRNDVRMGAAGLATQVASDATSQTNYLPSTYEPSGLLTTTELELNDAANWVLAHFKDPQLRITELTVLPLRAPTTLFPNVLAREIGDRITVKRRPQALGAAISEDLFIEGVRHDFAADGKWKSTWALWPADTQAYWLVGSNTLDTDTRLAY